MIAQVACWMFGKQRRGESETVRDAGEHVMIDDLWDTRSAFRVSKAMSMTLFGPWTDTAGPALQCSKTPFELPVTAVLFRAQLRQERSPHNGLLRSHLNKSCVPPHWQSLARSCVIHGVVLDSPGVRMALHVVLGHDMPLQNLTTCVFHDLDARTLQKRMLCCIFPVSRLVPHFNYHL